MNRFIKFGVVGLGGVAVQLTALWIFAHVFDIPPILATVMAVEIALLHNFVWRERWTWRGSPVERRPQRFLKFHLSNGVLSIAGNAFFTWIFLRYLPLLVANLAAIAVTTLLNFTLAHRWVFRREGTV